MPRHKNGSSKSQKAQYTKYANEGREETNRLRKLERHMKLHPEDTQAGKQLNKFISSSVPHRRHKPKQPLVIEPIVLTPQEKEKVAKYNKVMMKRMNAMFNKANKFATLPVAC